MREDICSIPITEVFEKKDGCPICRIYDMLETRMVDYIMGDAMMEPDIRIETNKKGFCRRHYDKMGDCRAKLAFSLVLNTHINRLMALKQSQLEKELSYLQQSCFVCEKIEWGVSHLLDTLFHLYEKETEFRALFKQQPYICLKHYDMLLKSDSKKKLKKHKKEFNSDLYAAASRRGKQLSGLLKEFSSTFDYHSKPNTELPNEIKHSIFDAVDYLSGR